MRQEARRSSVTTQVTELRAALEARGLPTDGLKKVLKERLLGALAGGDDGDNGDDGDDGAAPAAPEPEPEPAPAAPMDVEADAARPAADALTAAEVEKMKVYDLKLALEARGLSTDGSKKELKARLLAAITTSMDEGDEDSVPEVPGTTI